MTTDPIDQKTEERFARRLGLAGATNIGLGAMLGGGIYVIAGLAAGMIGPGLFLVYLATGTLTIFTALNYAELAASIPKAGGGYTFVHDTYGGAPAFFTGWFLLIGNIVACGLYSLAVAQTIAVFLPGSTIESTAVIAVAIISFTFVTNAVSVKSVSNVLGILNIAQSIVLFSFIALGFFFIQPANLDPLFAPGTGILNFLSTISFIYISFIGYELITTASEEIKNPARNIPAAIILTLIIATVVYIAAALVIVGVTPYIGVANSLTPIADVYGNMFGIGAFYLGLAGMAASNYAALNATFLATARVAYALGRDRFLPGFLERIHPRFRTPDLALITAFIAVSAFALTGRVDLVASLSGLAYLFGQVIVNSSVIQLRMKRLYVPGTFKTRFYPTSPILGIIVCLIFIATQTMEALQLGLWLAIFGLLIYTIYGRSRYRRHRAATRRDRVAETVRVMKIQIPQKAPSSKIRLEDVT
ncbi:MAG: amino acid permease [Candidatus Thorarchaeota archaeon]|nr:amino acid permease [Candidatus Thorarchaeota archaeon]